MSVHLKRLVFAALGAVSISAASMASSMVFKLSDHPDGSARPPTYGLRLDNMYNVHGLGNAGTTTFSFNVFNDVLMTVSTVGSDLNINISGTVYGGRDTGTSYGFGEGAYALDFNYTANVVADGTGWRVEGNSASNNGSLTALAGIAGVAEGTVFSFADKSLMDAPFNSFLFLQDDHRLPGHPEAGQGFWVGRGWMMYSTDAGGGSQDFLFIGEKVPPPPVIPLPTPLTMGAAGLLGVMALRRRR